MNSWDTKRVEGNRKATMKTAYTTPSERKYPELSDALQEYANRAATIGLSLAQYNSGVARNPKNGIRVFVGIGKHNYFRDAYIAHVQTAKELLAFLNGFEAGLKAK
jgi:hypothetical protein